MMMPTDQRLRAAERNLAEWSAALARIDRQRAEIEAADVIAAKARPGLALAAATGDASAADQLRGLAREAAERREGLEDLAAARTIAARMVQAATEAVTRLQALRDAERASADCNEPPDYLAVIDRAAAELAAALEKARHWIDKASFTEILWAAGLAGPLRQYDLPVAEHKLWNDSPPVAGACGQWRRKVVEPAAAHLSEVHQAADEAERIWSEAAAATPLRAAPAAA